MNCLARKELFSAGLESKLRDLGHSDLAIGEVRRTLESMGLLDDKRATSEWIRQRSGRRSLGRNRLRVELEGRGVDQATVEAVVGAIDDPAELQAMRSALESRPWKPGDRLRAARFLNSRGFEPELMETALTAHFGASED